MIKKALLCSFASLAVLSSAAAQSQGREEFSEKNAVEAAVLSAFESGETKKTGEYPRGPQPENSKRSWVKQVDYPPQAYLEDLSGIAGYRLAIAADGGITDCSIIGSSGHTLLDNATCPAIRKRAKFSPALGANGKPIAGEFEDSVHWRSRKQDLATFAIEVDMLWNEEGSVARCTLIEASGKLPRGLNKDDPCRGLGRRETPFRDENGVAVSKQVRVRMYANVTDPVNAP